MNTKILLLCLFSIFNFFSSLTAHDFLLIGTNAEFPPFTYIENKEIVGFDIDIAKEVAKKMGKTVKFKDMPFDALIPAISLNQVDFVAAGLSYTKERAKRVAFTKSYLSNDPLVIFTKAQTPLTLAELKGKNVVVIEGFTADTYMTSKESHLTRLTTQADGFMAIKSGRADAFITAKSTVDAFFQVQDATQFHTTILEGTGETCVLAVPLNKPQLLLQIQQALDEMEKEGILAKIKIKWKLS